ncbi:MAG: hypothetical protein KGL43_22620 [Burkholderiales bacterium]|nr:hypothetical protein [Burkholderiales bacterium]MDE2456391.1 hypothetical protein [Burkholderiales bacterium]
MKRLIAELIWRATVVAALAWIGWELHQIHQDMLQPDDSQVTASDAPDSSDLGDSVDQLRDDIAGLDQKVDALLLATAQLEK